MKKMLVILLSFVFIVTVFFTVISTYADRALTDQENAAFIVRDEWVKWKNDFIASLSQLDADSTAKIYEDMDFYDMQYRFTDAYKNIYDYDKQRDDYEKFEESVQNKIIEEKIKRGLI